MPHTQPTLTPVSILRQIAAITGQRDRDQLALTLVRTLSNLINSSHIAIYRVLPAEDDNEAILVAQASSSKTFQPREVSAIISSRPDFQNALDSKKEYIHRLDEELWHSVYPISDKQHITGLLAITSHHPTPEDRALISSFLMVYSNYLTILNESETDTLTGLLNRRTFENNIARISFEDPASDIPADDLQLAARRSYCADEPHWLAVMDIDHFKRINDVFGHLYGDEVLLLLSRKMKRVFRQSDKLFRFGGEEFVVVLDRTSQENAGKILERFRKAIEHYDFPQVGRVTISIGFVCLNGTDPSSLVGRADQALYYAKEHGRNQVCSYEGLLAEGKLAAEQFTDDVQLF
jgi:diguanylate cyclase (GGDEF)-like protein